MRFSFTLFTNDFAQADFVPADFFQVMSCEGACAHEHMQCAVARVCAKSSLKSVQDVRVCGSFWSVRCSIANLQTFWNEIVRKCYFLS